MLMLNARGGAPGILCGSAAAVMVADVLGHLLAVGHDVAALHASVTPPGVLPQDASAAGHTLVFLPDSC